MRLYSLVFISFISFSGHLKACSDIFINKEGYHIEARTLDFLNNLEFQEKIAFVGEEALTDIVLDGDKIPQKQLTGWKNKYGYVGRAVFEGRHIIDGMNTEGLAVAALYLPGAQFPAYNPQDHRSVLGIYDTLPFLLSQAATVSEAVRLLHSHQLVQSAAQYREDLYIKDIPVHYVIRDRAGESVVIEFIKGEVKIYEKAGNVLTNAPSFDWQLQNASYYDSLLADNKSPNTRFSTNFHNYMSIYESCAHAGEANLIGVPGDATPPSRFVKAKVFLANFPAPSSREAALYQASSLIDSLAVPALKGASPTLWISIKDLDKGIYYTKDLMTFRGGKTLHPLDITRGYKVVNLKKINFNKSPPRLKIRKKLINSKNVKIISAKTAKILGL